MIFQVKHLDRDSDESPTTVNYKNYSYSLVISFLVFTTEASKTYIQKPQSSVIVVEKNSKELYGFR